VATTTATTVATTIIDPSVHQPIINTQQLAVDTIVSAPSSVVIGIQFNQLGVEGG